MLAGYGLTEGLGWQFYLLAFFSHGAIDYPVILLQKGLLYDIQVEIYIAVLALAITAVTLWLRCRNPQEVSQDTRQSYL